MNPLTILLDSDPLSQLATPLTINAAPRVAAIRQWAIECDAAGHTLVVPEVVDYELRRELLRARKGDSITELDKLKFDLIYLPLTTEAMLKAAESWATVRQQGLPTAEDANIDVDVILAAQALNCGVPEAEIVVATLNPRHLSRFLAAKPWREINPSDGKIP